MVRDNRGYSTNLGSPWIRPFLLSTRFRDTAAFVLHSARHFFPSHLWSPQISPCSPGSRWMAFGLRRAKVLG